MDWIPWRVRSVTPLRFACIANTNHIIATRFSSQLKYSFGINVSQIELLGSMTIGILDEIAANSHTTESDSGPSTTLDGGPVKYGEPLVPILNDRLIYDEPYTTDASPHQYRTWLAQASYPTSSYTYILHMPPARARQLQGEEYHRRPGDEVVRGCSVGYPWGLFHHGGLQNSHRLE